MSENLLPNNGGIPQKSTSSMGSFTLLSLVFSCLSLLLSLCCCVVFHIPLGIIAGIFGITFAILGKSESGRFYWPHFLSFALSAMGIFLGGILFLALLWSLQILQNPAQFAEQAQYEQEKMDKLMQLIQDFLQNLGFLP